MNRNQQHVDRTLAVVVVVVVVDGGKQRGDGHNGDDKHKNNAARFSALWCAVSAQDPQVCSVVCAALCGAGADTTAQSLWCRCGRTMHLVVPGSCTISMTAEISRYR